MPHLKTKIKGAPWFRIYTQTWCISDAKNRPQTLRREDGTSIKENTPEGEQEAIAAWHRVKATIAKKGEATLLTAVIADLESVLSRLRWLDSRPTDSHSPQSAVDCEAGADSQSPPSEPQAAAKRPRRKKQ